jgi:hypothetical protein
MEILWERDKSHWPKQRKPQEEGEALVSYTTKMNPWKPEWVTEITEYKDLIQSSLWGNTGCP